MTIKFIANIAFDTFMFICFWAVFKEGPYATYAENIVLFVFWFHAIVGISWMFVTDPKIVQEMDLKMQRGKAHVIYGYLTVGLEIIILAALGHPVLAFFYALGAGHMMLEVEKANKT